MQAIAPCTARFEKRSPVLFQIVELGARERLNRCPCDIFAFEDRVEFDNFIAR